MIVNRLRGIVDALWHPGGWTPADSGWGVLAGKIAEMPPNRSPAFAVMLRMAMSPGYAPNADEQRLIDAARAELVDAILLGIEPDGKTVQMRLVDKLADAIARGRAT